MQALLGLISTDVVAVAVLAATEKVELTFLVRRRTAELDDDVEQAVLELDALFSVNHPPIKPRVHVGEPDPSVLESYGRVIYWAKPQGG
ncbi:hypothetical protein OHB49_38900 [Streptomyces sp. NBC_01717]|uniref:hypothetical protein n=1 Tax=Streptomyces sp. NBC_01717 TaxID=2975918 RepID=UPI002E309AAB|nr:hypothetical protein [Streptomyces sp. NBC_01717]